MEIEARPMTPEELARLRHDRPRWPFGSEREEARAEIDRGVAEILRFTAVRAWDANECGPVCCPREILIETAAGDFVLLESWSVLPSGETIGRECVAHRTPLRNILIKFESSGDPLSLESGVREMLLDFESRECEVHALAELPAEFRLRLASEGEE
jgi:hypothetical protein